MPLYLYHIVQTNDFISVDGSGRSFNGLNEVHIYSEEKVTELKEFWKGKKLYYNIFVGYQYDGYEDDRWYELSIDDIEFKKIVEVKTRFGDDMTDDPLVNTLIGLLQHREVDHYFTTDVLQKLDFDTSLYKRRCVKNELDQKYGETLSTSYGNGWSETI